MRELFNQIVADNLIKSTVIFSICLSLIGIVITVLLYSRFPPYIPLLNSMPWGVQRLAEAKMAIFLFILCLFVIFFNTMIGTFFYRKHPLILRILSVSSFLFVFLGFCAFIQILLLIF